MGIENLTKKNRKSQEYQRHKLTVPPSFRCMSKHYDTSPERTEHINKELRKLLQL